MKRDIKCIITDDKYIEDISKFNDQFSLLNPQYTSDWAKVFSEIKNCEFKYLVAFLDNELAGYLHFCICDGVYGKVVNSTPFIAYGGPISKLDYINEFMLNALIGYCNANGVLTLTLCTPAFSEEAFVDNLLKTMKPNYITENFYQYSLLDKHPLYQLTAKRRSAIKNEIHKGETSGVYAKITQDKDDFYKWLEIYYTRYKEIGAVPYPRDFFDGVYKYLVLNKEALLVVAKIEEEVIGGTLFILGHNIVDYFSSAYKTETRSIYPNSVVLDYAFNYFINQQILYFNWQSSPGKGGVYEYKARWGAAEDKHYYITKITGDVDSLLNKPLEEIKKVYKGYFVLPYSCWNN